VIAGPTLRPLRPAALVAAIYALWLAVVFAAGRDARDFTIINRAMVAHCHDSSVIRVDPSYHYQPPNIGYDGAFYYLIALDPLHAACYLDDANYRYSRILYPLAARVLALNQIDWIPVTMILVNFLSIVLGTWLLAAWLRGKGLSPWLALIYGLYPGLFVSLWRDLTEPLSYALVIAAIFLLDFGGRRKAIWAGCCFGLAALARETAVLFAIAYGVSLLRQRRWREAGDVLALGLLPLVWYKIFLHIELGGSVTGQPASGPFTGLSHWWPFQGEQIDVTLAVAVPGIMCGALALWLLLRRVWEPEPLALLLNVLVLIVLLPAPTYVEYYAAGRATTGVVLAALLCLPLLARTAQSGRAWMWTISICWMLPWYSLVPLALTWANPKI
jgi:hypothetical protein